MHHPHDPLHTLANGLGGIAATFLGTLTQFQEDIDWGMRFTLGLCSLFIAILTIRNLLRGKKRKPPEQGGEH
jgi:uncharacterized membrane protein YqgA involved in biofilm formation